MKQITDKPIKDSITGKVVKVIDEYTLVINKGSDHGITETDKFLIYYNEGEIFDPDSKESLGHLEIVCGEACVKHIQEKMTTVVRKTNSTMNVFSALFNNKRPATTEIESEQLPFKDIKEGCLFKTIE